MKISNLTRLGDGYLVYWTEVKNARGSRWCYKSTLVLIMVWCRHATAQYLSHCWPRSMSPWVKYSAAVMRVVRTQWLAPCRLVRGMELLHDPWHRWQLYTLHEWYSGAGRGVTYDCMGMVDIFSCDKELSKKTFLFLWVCPSVRPSHLFTMFPSSHHYENFRSYYQMTDVMSMQKAKVKVTEVKTQFSRFRTVTPVWIHIWWWNDAQSLILLRRGALLFFKVIRRISRSHG